MTFPTWVAKGTTVTAGAGTLSVPLPAGWQADDIHILVVESPNDTGVAVDPVTGYTLIAKPGYGTTTATSSSRLSVFWRRAVAGDGNASVTQVPFDHRIAFIAGFRGCKTTGTPYEALGSNTQGASATIPIPCGTTLGVDRLVVALASNHVDAAGAWINSMVNASLANVTERVDEGNTIGNGGRLALGHGEKAGAGPAGTFTMTPSANASAAFMAFSLIPPAVAALARSQAMVIA